MKDENPAKIDTHAHYLPSSYLQTAQDAFPGGADGLPGFPAWSAESALESMAELNISSSVLSVSSPGVHFGDDGAARSLARSVNEEGARLVHDHSNRFGLFASLPLPDVEGSLQEIEYERTSAHGGHHARAPGDTQRVPRELLSCLSGNREFRLMSDNNGDESIELDFVAATHNGKLESSSCSFCGRSASEVDCLLAGAGALITP